ncbi:PLP-dependent aminotransferase family protein [Herbiconiux moechotypicola]|uniref:PLP-dependent aminotransferase family protein n=1 Tax=Herbiconiux moechotypicola TaxID=637393 RepID=A0ABN3DLL8_9MICO|nr:PLP-dependent aminotransferase family protein [Herbiconiux moechotypicola]MCS5730170.1 PLP-dependent aminotransferase family protein [Herbiconiux moechotypicola]
MSDAKIGTRAFVALLGDWRGRASGPSYLALFDRIRLLVLDGRIPTDTRLPAERDLAQALGVSRTMVSAAYRELRDAGYTRSIRGSGSVARLPGRAPVTGQEAPGDFIDFSKATMPAYPGLFDATQAAMAGYAVELGGTGIDPFGSRILREAVAERYTARGLPTSVDQVMITIGAQHAIFLLARTLMSRGDRAVVELPSYPHAYEALRMAGARLVPVTVSARGSGAAPEGLHGWDAAGLAQAFARTSPALAYLMPDFHNPTGESMPEELRARLLHDAARQGSLVVADETTAELDIDRAGSFLPLAAYGDAATADSAVLIGSVGKTVWAGLRVGWIRATPAIIRKLAAARFAGDLGTPVLEQLVVAELLRDFDPVLRLRSAQLRAGRDELRGLLAEAFPEWQVPAVDGGLAVWANIGAPVSSQLALAARSHGLLITAGPRFGIDGAFERSLRVPIGYENPDLVRGVQALAAAWRTVSAGPVPHSELYADVV